MKVNNYGNIQGIMKTYMSRKKEGVGPATSPQVSDGEDTLELSVQAREMQDVKTSLRDMKDVRDEKVGKIKEEIASGGYKADAGRIAEGIIKERLLDKQV